MLVNDICQELDWDGGPLLVLLDLSTAFDIINHHIFLHRKQDLGIGSTIIQCIVVISICVTGSINSSKTIKVIAWQSYSNVWTF